MAMSFGQGLIQSLINPGYGQGLFTAGQAAGQLAAGVPQQVQRATEQKRQQERAAMQGMLTAAQTGELPTQVAPGTDMEALFRAVEVGRERTEAERTRSEAEQKEKLRRQGIDTIVGIVNSEDLSNPNVRKAIASIMARYGVKKEDIESLVPEAIKESNQFLAVGGGVFDKETQEWMMPPTKNVGDLTHEEKIDLYKNFTTESAEEYIRTNGQSLLDPREKPQQDPEMSVFLEKQISSAADAIGELDLIAIETGDLINELSTQNFAGGLASDVSEAAKRITGQRDYISQLRTRANKLRASEAMKNLPPGSASDADVALALKGVPPENADSEEFLSFLRGIQKLSAIASQYNQFKADYISRNKTQAGMVKAWKESQKPKQDTVIKFNDLRKQ